MVNRREFLGIAAGAGASVITAEFVTDQSGGVTQIITDGVAVEFRILRKGSTPVPASAVKPARVPRSVLQRYVGVYATEFVIDDAGVTQVMGTGFQQMLARSRKTNE